MSTTNKKLLQNQTANGVNVQTFTNSNSATKPGTSFGNTAGGDVATGPSNGSQTQRPVQGTTQQGGGQNVVQGGNQNYYGSGNASGVTGGTMQTLNQLAGGYKPSQAVLNAQAGLENIIANKPGDFTSNYTDMLDNIYNQIIGRDSFKYDLANDPMYQQYRQQYIQAGRNAMQDTMGQAAALTGGYGSSYATTAGQQAYNQHLQQLNDRIPELHQMALDAYNAEGDALNQKYSLTSDAYNRDLAQWQEQYNRWKGDRDFASTLYDSERTLDYNQYANLLNHWRQMASLEQSAYDSAQSRALQAANLQLSREQMQNSQANTDRSYYLGLATTMINAGKTPPDSILLQAGLTADEIAALKQTSSKSSSSGSGKGTSSDTGLNVTTEQMQLLQDLIKAASGSGNNSSGNNSSGNWLGSAASSVQQAVTSKTQKTSEAALRNIFDSLYSK